MSKIGRNDPCWCGSGRKYKQCHLPQEEAAAAEIRRLRTAGDEVLLRVIERAQQHVDVIPAAFERYWNGKYTPDQMAELDELEGRGAERFLTWFAFDEPLADGRTLVQQLAAGVEDFPLSEDEARVLASWTDVRLRPYVVTGSVKGKEIHVRELVGEREFVVDDQAGSQRVEPGEVLIVHLLPVVTKYYIGGAAAHLTADTADKLRDFLDLHREALQREQPDATSEDVLQAHSEVLNHFVMELPVEAPDPTVFDRIMLQTRVALALTGDALGFNKPAESNKE